MERENEAPAEHVSKFRSTLSAPTDLHSSFETPACRRFMFHKYSEVLWLRLDTLGRSLGLPISMMSHKVV